MTLKLADPGAQGLFPTVEIPIVGGRHHGRFVTAPNGGGNLKKENYIEGEYYSPRFHGMRCLALHPRRWSKMGVDVAIRMCEVYGPLHQRWPDIQAVGGIAHGSLITLSAREAKGDRYYMSSGAPWALDNRTEPYRFWQAESGTFYFIPYDWPEAEIPARAARAKILGREA